VFEIYVFVAQLSPLLINWQIAISYLLRAVFAMLLT